MTGIAQWPFLARPGVFAGASVAAGLPLSQIFRIVAPEAYAAAFPLWPIVIVILTGVLLAGGLALGYPRVTVDLDAGTARFGFRTVPISSITRATRSHSGGRAGYLVYRLYSDTGASARIIVLGSATPQIDDDGANALATLIATAPIAEPETDENRALTQLLSESVLGTGRKLPVGRRALLDELARVRAVRIPADSAPPPAPQATAAQQASAEPQAPAEPRESVGQQAFERATDEERLAMWERDDREAAVIADAVTLRARRWRGVLRGTAATAGVAAIVAVVAGFTGSTGWIGLGPSLLLVLAGWIGGRVATDRLHAALRTAGRAWLDADPGRRSRGLAVPFVPGWPVAGNATATWLFWAGVPNGIVVLLFLTILINLGLIG